MNSRSNKINPDWNKDRFVDDKPRKFSEEFHRRFDHRSRTGVNLTIGGFTLGVVGGSIQFIESIILNDFIKTPDIYKLAEGTGLGLMFIGGVLLSLGSFESRND